MSMHTMYTCSVGAFTTLKHTSLVKHLRSAPPNTMAASARYITDNDDEVQSVNNQDIKIFDSRKGVKYLADNATHLKTLPSEFILPLQSSPLLSSAGHASIPVIDLSGLDHQSSVESKRSTIRAISTACADWGFFRVINHCIPTSLMEETIQVVEGFFDLSLEEKMKYASDNVMDPVRYGTSLNTSVNHPRHWRDYLRHYGHPIHNTFHLWPDKPSNYRDAVARYLETVWQLALKIAGAISEGLGLDHDYIEKSLGEGSQILAANYYPPCPEPEKTLGLAGHSDHGGLTILMQNGVDGLQVKYQGSWVAVQNVPGTFVVNIGDFLEVLSNGRYKSVEHRATVNGHKTRISVAVGHGPEWNSIMAPATPLLNTPSDAKYHPITYKDYMKRQQSSSVRGKTPLSSIMTNNTNAKA